MDPIFETILKEIPAPVDNSDEPLQFQVSLLDYNDYLGRVGIGRIFRGELNVGDNVSLNKLDGTAKTFRVTQLFGFYGLERREIESAKAGDIVAVAGFEDIFVGETVTPTDHLDPLPVLRIDEPTLQMTFAVNNSPFAGREGKWVTSSKIDERLQMQLQTDVSLRVEPTESPDSWTVSGRGELHLSVLIENMRREGFELQVSKPKVIIKEIDGVTCEPFEAVQIDTPEEYMGTVIERLSARKAVMQEMENFGNGQVRLTFQAPSRGLIGFTNEFLSITHGYGIMNHSFSEYLPAIKEVISGRRNGSLVSSDNGKATTYSIMNLEDRGTIFVEPGTEVYEGMIVGENNRETDLAINLTKQKQKTNVRSANKDQTNVIKEPRHLTLEESMNFIGDDEYCEVTPESVRLRKMILDTNTRAKANKNKDK